METTIPSLLLARTNRDAAIAGQQQTTRAWWENRRRHYILHVSELVLDEISQGEPAMVAARQAA